MHFKRIEHRLRSSTDVQLQMMCIITKTPTSHTEQNGKGTEGKVCINTKNTKGVSSILVLC